MSMKAIVGALRVVLGMDSAAFDKGATDAEKRAARLRKNFDKIGKSMQGFGRKMSVGVTAPLTALAYKSVDAMKVQERAVAAVDAALESMGDAAGYNRDQLHEMASAMQGNSLYGDEEILQKVTANLLTFGNVQGEVFERGQQLALDLSARLGTDLQSSAIMLGKALNDPAAGLTALTRVGVSFTEQQKEQIKAMVAAGNVAGAQALMLDELEKQYKGQAAALANTDSGKIEQAMMAIGDAMEKIGVIVLPVMAEIAGHVKTWAERFQELSPEVREVAVKAALLAAAVGPLAIGLGVLVSTMAPLAGVIMAVVSPIGLVVAGVAALTVVVWRNREAIGKWISETWEKAKEIPGKIAGAISAGIDAVKAALDRIWDAIKTEIATWPQKMADLGGNLIDGLILGVKNKIDDAKATIKSVASSIYNVFAKENEVRSPSRVFMRLGHFLMDGLGLGIDQGAAGAAAKMKEAAKGIAARMSDGIGKFEGMEKSVSDLGETSRNVFERMGGWLVGLAKGTKTLRGTITDLMSSWSRSLTQSGMSGLGNWLGGTFGRVGGGLLTGILGGLMGFANGGSFEVGGTGGIDSQLVAFRASPDERVTVTRPDQIAPGGGSAGGVLRVMIESSEDLKATAAMAGGRVAVEVVNTRLGEFVENQGRMG